MATSGLILDTDVNIWRDKQIQIQTEALHYTPTSCVYLCFIIFANSFYANNSKPCLKASSYLFN